MNANAPETSTTLLKEIMGDSQSARWSEFVERYSPMMHAFMSERFPFMEADEIIQQTLIALVRVLPSYRYNPKETGSFHNYLTGILRNKALNALRKQKHDDAKKAEYVREYLKPDSDEEHRIKDLQESIFEIALQQLLANDEIHGRTRQIFTRVAVNGEKPEDVAKSFGMTRNAVDQTKNRMMIKLREYVAALETLKSDDE